MNWLAQSICGSVDQRVSGSGDRDHCLLFGQTLFNNLRVSRLAALLVAFFPSLILWSSQALKDGLLLALALGILATLRLMEKITVGYVLILDFDFADRSSVFASTSSI